MLVCRPSKIVTARYVSLSLASGTESATHPLTRLIDHRNPANPFWAVDSPVVAVRAVWDHGEDVRIDAVSLAKHNLDAGLAVRVQRNGANDWADPAQDVALAIAAAHEDGHSTSPWCDLAAAAGYRPTGYRYTSLYVPVNSVAPRLGGLAFIEQFEVMDPHFEKDLRLGERRPIIWALETEANVRSYYRRRIRERYVRGHGLPTDAEMQRWRAIWRETEGGYAPFVIILNDTVTTDGALMVRCSEATNEAFEWGEDHPLAKPIALEFDELSRGLPSF
jgi:hypothetical protein